jgi:phage shock protein PspC (stress-responsive transcriptional regulator)
MRLTQKQEWMISRYLRDVNAALGSMPASARDQTLTRLNARIYRRLSEISAAGRISDEDVMTALRESGSPDRRKEREPASQDRRRESVPVSAPVSSEDDIDDDADDCMESDDDFSGLTLSSDDRVLLGVCGGIAGHFGLEARWARAAFFALGVTGPIALIAYICLYAEMYLHSNPEKVPRVDTKRIGAWVTSTFVGLVGLNLIMRLFLWGVLMTYERVANLGPLSGLGYWDWLRANSSFFLFCALSGLIPIAILGSLPVPESWNYTFKRVIQAGAVVYAFLLSFGVASFLVGAILHAVKGVAA